MTVGGNQLVQIVSFAPLGGGNALKEKEKRKEKRGSKGMPPLSLQTQTCQKNNLVGKTVVQEKFIFSCLKELAGKYRRSNETVYALVVQLPLYTVMNILDCCLHHK